MDKVLAHLQDQITALQAEAKAAKAQATAHTVTLMVLTGTVAFLLTRVIMQALAD